METLQHAHDAEILAGMGRRFYGNGPVRNLPLSMASPPPPDPTPRPQREPVAVVRVAKPVRVKVAPVKAAPARRQSMSRNMSRATRVLMSVIATSPCEFDGEPHVWSPNDRARVVCRKCMRKVQKCLIPGLVIVRNLKATEFKEPCWHPGGHKAKRNGIRHWRQQMRCVHCGRTRAANEMESAAFASPVQPVSLCHLHGAGECGCPAYLIAMGVNDAVLESQIEAEVNA